MKKDELIANRDMAKTTIHLSLIFIKTTNRREKKNKITFYFLKYVKLLTLSNMCDIIFKIVHIMLKITKIRKLI